MSRVQTQPDFYQSYNELSRRVSALERRNAATTIPDINTAGLSSAQIDAALMGGSAQASDGLMITDKTNGFLLVRIGGEWGRTAALTIIP